MKIYRIKYALWYWEYKWTSEEREDFIAGDNEDEALMKCFLPAIKNLKTIELKSIEELKVR